MQTQENEKKTPDKEDPTSSADVESSKVDGESPLNDQDNAKMQESYVIPPLKKITDAAKDDIKKEQIEVSEIDQLTPDEQQQVGESKARRIIRRLIRWVAGLLIIFGFGLITGIYVLYKPATSEAEKALNDLKDRLVLANEEIFNLENQISNLENQISELEIYKDENDQLLAEQNELNLHLAILKARIDVVNALLAVEQENTLQAQLSLDKTEENLDQLRMYLEIDQLDVVDELKIQLNWIKDNLEDSLTTAQQDLEALGAKLLQIEDDLTK